MRGGVCKLDVAGVYSAVTRVDADNLRFRVVGVQTTDGLEQQSAVAFDLPYHGTKRIDMRRQQETALFAVLVTADLTEYAALVHQLRGIAERTELLHGVIRCLTGEAAWTVLGENLAQYLGDIGHICFIHKKKLLCNLKSD